MTPSRRARRSSSRINRSWGTAATPRFSKADTCAMRACACVIVAMLILAGCAEYAEVKPKRAVLQGPSGAEPLASAEKEIERARRHIHPNPLDALGHCVEALDIASRELRRD